MEAHTYQNYSGVIDSPRSVASKKHETLSEK
jgi:hypothetical protein